MSESPGSTVDVPSDRKPQRMAAERLPAIPTPRQVRLPPTGAVRPRSPRCRPRAAVFEQVGRPTPGGITWLWARTDLDMATVAGARRELAVLLAPERDPGVVLLYLGRERFVDLRGLRLLVGTAGQARSRGGTLAVVAPPYSLVRLVRLGRVGADLPLVATARQAVRWARAGGTGVR